jgi:hypothetical protein
MGDGIDFFFANKSVALKFKDFVGSVVPIRCVHNIVMIISSHTKEKRKLIEQNQIKNFKGINIT